METKEIKLVISDLHLGSGLLTEEGEYNFKESFSDDSMLASFLKFYRTEEYTDYQVELIINGDFFEMLEVTEFSKSPFQMTAELACERIKKIIEGHLPVFQSLKEFLSTPNKFIRFIPGNHDMAIVFPGVQELLRNKIGKNLQFSTISYSFSDVYVEHGNQHHLCTQFDLDNLITNKEGKAILNLDWGSLMGYYHIYKDKNEVFTAPYNIIPAFKMLKWLLVHSFVFAVKWIVLFIYYSFKSLYVLKHKNKNWTFVFTLIKTLLTEDFSRSLEKTAKKMLLETNYNKVVFGHSHSYRFREYSPNKIYVNTGGWIKVTNLATHSLGTWKKFCYAYIEVNGDSSSIELKEWKGIHVPDLTIAGQKNKIDHER